MDRKKLVNYNVGSSTTFENVLNSGDSECEYQVTVILKSILGDEYKESNLTITVLPSTAPATTAISSLLSQANATSSYKTILSILSSISLTSETGESETAKSNIDNTYRGNKRYG